MSPPESLKSQNKRFLVLSRIYKRKCLDQVRVKTLEKESEEEEVSVDCGHESQKKKTSSQVLGFDCETVTEDLVTPD